MVNVAALLNYYYGVANVTAGVYLDVAPGISRNLPIKVGDHIYMLLSAWGAGTLVQLKMNVNGVVTNVGTPVTIDVNGTFKVPESVVATIYSTSVPTWAEGGGKVSGTINLTGTPEPLAILSNNGFPTNAKVNSFTNFTLTVKNSGYGKGALTIRIKNTSTNPGPVTLTLTGGSPSSIPVGSQLMYTAFDIPVGGTSTLTGTIIFTTVGEHIIRISYGHGTAAGTYIDDGYVDVG